MKISILYGTETGNAEMLAEDILAHIEGEHEATCANLSDTDPANMQKDTFYLVVCSTYGDGELPASAQPFAEALVSGKADLSGIFFAAFGLGDQEYEETFNFGSKEIVRLLTAHGATQLGPRPTHDASGPDMPEDLAMPWADEVLELAWQSLSVSA
jgi:MioC protein